MQFTIVGNTGTFYLTPENNTGNRVITITNSSVISFVGNSITYDAVTGNATQFTITAGNTVGTFYVTAPTNPGNRNITITTSPALVYNGSPVVYDATFGNSLNLNIPSGCTVVNFYLTPSGSSGIRELTASSVPVYEFTNSPYGYTVAGGPISATLSGPTAGQALVSSSTFTVTLDNGTTNSVTVNLSSTVSGDTFQAVANGSSVNSVVINNSTFTTFYLTPGNIGNRNVSITTSPALTYYGTPITYYASAGPPSTAVLLGPASGNNNYQSSGFVVLLNEPAQNSVTISLSSSNGSDTFQNSTNSTVASFVIPSASQSGTFYLTPGGSPGNRNISISTNAGLTIYGSPAVYNAIGFIACSPGRVGKNKSATVTFYGTGVNWGSAPTITASGNPTSDASWSVANTVLVNSTVATIAITTGNTTGTVTWTDSTNANMTCVMSVRSAQSGWFPQMSPWYR